MGRSFIAAGHNVDFIPTDKDIYFPKDLNPYLKQAPYGNYDIQISYTQPGNWKEYFKYSGKKFAIWNFEYQLAQGSPGLLLPGFGKNHVHVDMIFPSSQFSKKVFMDMGVPESKLIVIPHGVDVEKFQTKEKWTLKTKKSKKILLNIMQPHTRKNIPAALEVYGRAFTNKDDVCLVCKVFVKNKKNNQFDVVTILGNSFGYFESAEDDQLVLGEIFRILKAEGKLLVADAESACNRRRHPCLH